jgi:hypothetical protein
MQDILTCHSSHVANHGIFDRLGNLSYDDIEPCPKNDFAVFMAGKAHPTNAETIKGGSLQYLYIIILYYAFHVNPLSRKIFPSPCFPRG